METVGLNLQQIYEAGEPFERLIDHPSWIERIKFFVGGEGTFDYHHGPLFIDEGFGTLDADTLEAVMGVLDELRAGGRVVGIVSHVDEMRQRIPSRLHVIRNRDGSTLQLFAAS